MSALPIIIRDYEQSEISILLAVIRAAFSEYEGKLDPPSSAERKTVEIVRQELEKAQAIVAESNSEIIGCVFYQTKPEGVYLDRLSVLPEHRKGGVGTQLIKEVQSRAQNQGQKALLLSVRLSLEKQQAYYKKLGFEFDSFGTHSGYYEPTYMNMKKKLE